MAAPSAPGSQSAGFALIGMGAGARLVGIAIGVIAGLATLVLTVRLLDTAEYGAFAFALSTATVLAGLGRLGLEPAVTRAIALTRTESATQSGRIARGAFTIVAITGLVGSVALAGLIVVGLDDLAKGTQVALAVGLGLSLYGSNVVAVAASVARGAGRVVRMELPLLAATLCRLAVVLVLTAVGVVELAWVAIGYGIAALAGIALAVSTASSVIGDVRRMLVPDLHAGRAVFDDALPFAVVGIAAVVLARFDVVILGLSATDAEVGGYEPVLRIVEQVMLIVPLLFVAQYLPVATRVHARGDVEGFRELYLGLSKLSYILAFPGVLILAVFPEAVIETLYGDEFPFDPAVVRLLLVGFVVNLCFGLNASALSSVGSRRALARSGAVTIASMIVLALTLVPALGANGAALATSGTYVAFNCAVAVELFRAEGVLPLRTDYVVTLLTSALPLLVGFWISSSLRGVGLIGALVISLALSAVWAVALIGARVLRREELRRLMPRKADPQ